MELTQAFKTAQQAYFADFIVKEVLADCFYRTKEWTIQINEIYPNAENIDDAITSDYPALRPMMRCSSSIVTS
ncbi:MAG: hypothetical protein AAF806_13170 [Bacteroidota bacterium]